ncbi:hypothetical protein GCM10022419_083060 [Nonomuraea rosea]|uniref:LPXTG cell wall anchor domain-containing protein n=1 Tax=Nonomuraea rosea TaxID=638574 RepID=A0ABP6YTC5_9ACTN
MEECHGAFFGPQPVRAPPRLVAHRAASKNLYWAMQWGETAVYLTLALALTGIAYLAIRRRA